MKIDNVNMSKMGSVFEVGRAREVERVVRFLQYPYGGSLLLCGDRGSGKTTLIDIAISRYEATLYQPSGSPLPLMTLIRLMRRVTMSRIIKINIPLIIIDPEEGDKERNVKEKYRSMFMRAMLIGLEADLARRYWGWLDLPRRWFRSIGYVQGVYAMRPYSHYLSLNKTTSRILSGPSNIGPTPAVQSALSAEIDLTDSTIEIKLRDLLSQYSANHDFIFVFDELDKLPTIKGVELESIVLYLKNLFSETGVHAIFISSEKDLKRIVEKSSNIPPSEENTLFIDHVLLNNLKMDEFSEIIQKRVVRDRDDVNMYQLVSALSLKTRRSPHELNKFFVRYGISYSDLIRGLKIELGDKHFLRFGVMQLFIDHIYKKFSGLFDENYDRILNESLLKAGSLLLESKNSLISAERGLTIFYTPEYFREDNLAPDQTLANEKAFKSKYPDNTLTSIPEIVSKIKELHNEQQNSVEGAVEALILLLNRTRYLAITDTDTGKVFALKGIKETDFTYDGVKTDEFDAALELTDKEAQIFDIVMAHNPAYSALTGANIFGALPIIASKNSKSVQNYYNIYSLSSSTVVWEQLGKVALEARRRVLEAMVAKISQKTAQPLDITTVTYSGGAATIGLPNGKKVRLLVILENKGVNDIRAADKTFVFRVSAAASKKTNKHVRVKNFSLRENWSNVDSCLNQVAVWINNNS